MSNKLKFKLTEEIARWAAEVKIRQEKNWWIAFSNPTAGPWKKVTAPHIAKNIVEEIYRFSREENRPDIIFINDNKQVIVINEAKDQFQKLTTPNQLRKSAQVIEDISSVLGNVESGAWGNRNKYSIIPSFLWCENDKSRIVQQHRKIEELFFGLKGRDEPCLNIVVSQENSSQLEVHFVYKGKIYSNLGMSLTK